MGFEAYRAKRDFSRTPEPAPGKRKRARKDRRTFVVHKHGARSLHYDLRLEFGGALKSWAVPKGPSLDPGTRRLAVRVEDHPLEYGSFEGVIPAGEYGAGPVMVWDSGEWRAEGPVSRGLEDGNLTFELQGSKLRGVWHLVRTSWRGGKRADGHENWLLIKSRDDYARPPEYDVLADRPESVTSGRTLEEIAAAEANPGARPAAGRASSATPSGPGTQPAAGADRAAARRSGGTASEASWRRRGSPESRGGRPKAAAEPGPRRPRRSSSRAATGRHPTPPIRAEPEIAGARRAPLPASLSPQLPTLVAHAPDGDDWLHELKYDGYRLLCRIDRGNVKLLTRSGKDWTQRFPGIAEAAASLPLDRALLDGEAVVIRPDGTTDFQAMQNVLERGAEGRIVYMAFDLLHLDGKDLRPVEQLTRKEALEALLASAEAGGEPANSLAGPIRYSDHIVGHGPEVFREACRLGAEGIVAKRIGRPYREGRTRDWLKVKCQFEQEFVIVGWTDPRGSRTGFGSLLLAYYDDDGGLRYAGRVGTGFTAASLEALRARLGKLRRATPPVAEPPRASSRGAHWVEPRLVAEVAFTEWTRDGQLRHPSFKGLREDRDPRHVRRELPVTPATGDGAAAQEESGAMEGESAPGDRSAARPARKSSGPGAAAKKRPRRGSAQRAAAPIVAGVRLTNADRVYFPELGVTKRELVGYYEAVGDAILPHAADRPLTIVRCPEGRARECFYQKHIMPGFPTAIRRIRIRESGGTRTYFSVSDLTGIVYLVQIGTLEFHAWGARRDRIDRPEVLIFDLDPGPGVPWSSVVDAAYQLRDRLGQLGLESFPKSTGGKGLHVVAPLVRRNGWDEVKDFAHAIASAMAGADPSRYTDQAAKEKRKGRIYVDYLRNARGATAIVAFSTRARPGAPVSVPLAWEEVTPKLDPARFDVRSVPSVVDERREAWAGYGRVRQSLTVAMKAAVGLG